MTNYADEYFGDGATAPPAGEIDVATAASNPKQASGDGISVTQHSLPDLIMAEKHLAGKAQGRNKYRGIRFTKLVPPGTTDNSASN